MSLTQALSTALTGLTAAQTALSVTAGNIANAQTPGYVRKQAVQVETAFGATGIGVSITEINRVLDQFIQQQLRTESSGAAYADLSANFYQQIQSVYGQPGSDGSLETIYNNFTTALQALTTSPDDPSTQAAVIGAAQVVAQQLNAMTDGIQSLRAQAELGISADVTAANNAIQQIAELNQRISGSTQNDATSAALEDQRDRYIAQLSQLMDIKVITNNNQVSVFTSSGVQLVGLSAAQLSFDAQGAVAAQSQWSADPSKSTLGTITLTAPNGSTTDLIASGGIHSGEIAAYLQMRDQVLVQAQNQLDQFAAAMSSALSDRHTDGTAVTSGAQNGFTIDTAPLLDGNSITINYTDTATNTPHTLTLVRTDDSTALPLSNDATLDPNDTVVGIDFSSATPILTQISAALAGTGMTASLSGTTLQILDDGAADTVNVDSVSSTTTVTSLSAGTPQLPFFLDNNQPYSGANTGAGPQSVGFAGRISVNPALIDDPSALVSFQPGTAAADDTRPQFIFNQMTASALQYSPSSGIGSTTAPFTGSLGSYLQHIISQQGQAATDANNLKQGQDVVLNSLQQRFNANSGVNIDEEMTNLLNLQNEYAANARVMSAVKDMISALLQM
ncbi:MAG TPA: flagellar hook-associated protein FlgK [Pseudolabrys sp.]|jgi:flagellar hook-associated protein 1 FlgK|nr:flagellar hook-associated protein FlgK [Pseudolabrys sp.]